MLKVLLVDDEPYILQGLSVLIDWGKEGFEIVGKAGSAREMADAVYRFYQMDAGTYDRYCSSAQESVKQYDFEHLTEELERILCAEGQGVR